MAPCARPEGTGLSLVLAVVDNDGAAALAAAQPGHARVSRPEEVILSTGRWAAILRTKYPDVSLEETLRRHTTRITISKWMRAKLPAVNDQLKCHRHEHHPGVRAVAA